MGCDLQFKDHSMQFFFTCHHSINILEESFFSVLISCLLFSIAQILHTKIKDSLCLFIIMAAHAEHGSMNLSVALGILAAPFPFLGTSL